LASKRSHTIKLRTVEIQLLNLLMDGFTTEEAAMLIYDCRDDKDPCKTDEDKKRKAIFKCQHMLRNESLIEEYNRRVKQMMLGPVTRANRVLTKQLDDENGWLANKAANDILVKYGPKNVEEENTITVKVEGLPELGTPDSAETDVDEE